MTYATLESYNVSQGLHVLFIAANDMTGGILSPLILIFFASILFIGTYYGQKRTTGFAEPAAAFSVATFLTAGLALLMLLIPNLINVWFVVIAVAFAVLGFIVLIMSNIEKQ